MFISNQPHLMIFYWAIFAIVFLVEIPNSLKLVSAANVSSSDGKWNKHFCNFTQF